MPKRYREEDEELRGATEADEPEGGAEVEEHAVRPRFREEDEAAEESAEVEEQGFRVKREEDEVAEGEG